MTDKSARNLIEILERKLENQARQITALQQQLEMTHTYVDPKDFPPVENGPVKWSSLPSTNFGPAELNRRFQELYEFLGVSRIELNGTKLEKR
jgi:hypothetical protein